MASHINSKRPAAVLAALFGALLLALGLSSCESPLDSTVGPHEIDTLDWVGPGERPDEEKPEPRYVFRPLSILGGWSYDLNGQGVFDIPEFWFPEFSNYSISLAVSEDNGGNATMSFTFDLSRSDEVVVLPYFPAETEILLTTAVHIDLNDVPLVGDINNGFFSTQGEIPSGGTVEYGVLEDSQSTEVQPVGAFPCSVVVLILPDEQIPELLQLSIVIEGMVHHSPHGDVAYHGQFDFIRVPIN